MTDGTRPGERLIAKSALAGGCGAVDCVNECDGDFTWLTCPAAQRHAAFKADAVFRPGAMVQIIVVIPPRYSPAFLTLFGPTAKEIAQAVLRLTGHEAGDLQAIGRKGVLDIELRERSDVGPGMLVAMIDQADGADVAKALLEIERG